MFAPNETISLTHHRYTILDKLSSGGQGTVWRVHGQDQKNYALKIVNVRDSRDSHAPLYSPEQMQRLLDYANAEMAFLQELPEAAQHHIAPCVDYGMVDRENYSLPTFVMPLYTGNLSHYLDEKRYQNQAVTFTQWQRWFKQLLTALHYMQTAYKGDKRPVHRDLKPSNLLLDDAQNLFLTDFGIVRESNEVGTTSIVYSYFYCAPEQRLAHYVTDNGDAHFYITPALDVYAAGIILHEILAGQTQAQKELNDERKKLQHERTLHRLDHKPSGKVGLLGKIGGLTEREYDYLHKLISAGMGEDSDTLIVQYTGLPHNGKISQAYAQLVRAMLAPWPDDRPSIASVLQTLTRLEYAQQPQLVRFALDNVPLSVTVGQKLTVFLVIHGKGLPQTLDWLAVELNQQALKNISFQLLDEQHNDHYYQRRYQLILPEFNHEKAAVLRIWTRIHGKQRQIQQTINVLPNAEYLWQQGKRLEALQLEPRAAWLDDWEQAAQTVSEKYELLMALQTLQAQYPQNEALVQRYQKIEYYNSTTESRKKAQKTQQINDELIEQLQQQALNTLVSENQRHGRWLKKYQTEVTTLMLRQAWLFGLEAMSLAYPNHQAVLKPDLLERLMAVREVDLSTERYRIPALDIGDIESIAYSPDGKCLATGSKNHNVRLWNAVTGELQHTLKGHKDWVRSVSFSPNGSRLASGSDDNTIKLWDSRTGALQHTLKGHKGWVRSVSFSPDGSRLASGSSDNTIKLWDSRTGELQHTLEGHKGWVRSVSFSPDGNRLASGSWDTTIKLWDSHTGALQHTLKGHKNDVYSVSFSPDGNRLASGSWDTTIKLWYSHAGALQHTLKGHKNDVYSVSFSPDGNRLASGSRDDTIKLWDSHTGELQHTLEGHQDDVISVSFSPDGKQLVSGSNDNILRFWDVPSEQNKQGLAETPTYRLLHEFDPNTVLQALKILWRTERNDMVVRDYNYNMEETGKFRPLLDMPNPDETKLAQLVRLLEQQCAYKDPKQRATCQKK